MCHRFRERLDGEPLAIVAANAVLVGVSGDGGGGRKERVGGMR